MPTHAKALALGNECQITYRNPEGKLVRFKFRGLRDLNVVVDGGKLQHGAELTCTG